MRDAKVTEISSKVFKELLVTWHEISDKSCNFHLKRCSCSVSGNQNLTAKVDVKKWQREYSSIFSHRSTPEFRNKSLCCYLGKISYAYY